MNKYQNAEKIGLRDKQTNEVVAVYPKRIEGTDAEIEDNVKFWFCQQSCSAEEVLKNLYVDVLTLDEAEAHKDQPFCSGPGCSLN